MTDSRQIILIHSLIVCMRMYDLYSEPVRTVDVAELRLRLYYLRIVTYMGKSQG